MPINFAKPAFGAALTAFAFMHSAAIAQSVKGQEDYRGITGSNDVAEIARQMQNQARSVVAEAKASNNSSQISQLMNSPALTQEATRGQFQHQKIIEDASGSVLEKIRKQLPSVAKAAGGERFGGHVTVSEKGEEVIALFKDIPRLGPAERMVAFRQIQAYADKGLPEAINILGFIFEHGAFGTPADQNRALSFYKTAGRAGYQPGIYNVGLAQVYGKATDSNFALAAPTLSAANKVTAESSGRVCGLTSFVYYRLGKNNEAINTARSCSSLLSNLVIGALDSSWTLPERINRVRTSIASGADDGFSVLEQLTRPTANADASLLFCKYTLVKRYRHNPQHQSLNEQANSCIEQYAPKSALINKDSAVKGVASFVRGEIEDLKRLRSSNRFHFSWGVPYLPFHQEDVDLFAPSLTKGKP